MKESNFEEIILIIVATTTATTKLDVDLS